MTDIRKALEAAEKAADQFYEEIGLASIHGVARAAVLAFLRAMPDWEGDYAQLDTHGRNSYSVQGGR